MKIINRLLASGLVLITLLASPLVAADYLPESGSSDSGLAPLVDIRNARRVFPGILSGGQPTDGQLVEAQQKGFKTIINLRSAAEMQDSDEPERVRALGMTYISIPVAGPGDVNHLNSQRLVEALRDQKQYPVLVHCASGNRVGALFALDAAVSAALPVDQAIAVGKQAGMTRLELVVRTRLEGME